MAGLISDIVGGNVDSDLDKLVAKLAAVEKELDVINGKAISIKVDLQGVGTLSELTNLYKQQDDILTKLRSTSVQYVDTYKMATEAIAKHNGQTQKVVAVSDKIAATLLKEAKAREVNARAADKEAALSEKVSRQKEKETQSVEKAAAAKQKAAEREIADYNRGAAAADKAAAAKQREIDKEIANYNKGAQAAQRHAEMTAKQRERAEKTSQKYQAELRKETQAIADKLAKETAALQIADNAYIVLRNEYNKQSTALKGMIIQYGEADAAVIKMKVDVDAMYQSLSKAEQAVGQHQRKVGQYQNATFALSQLIREAPAFTYSVTTGLMGIGNNIPILLDQFKLLRAEVGSTGKALKIMGASLFGFTNLISIGLMVLTMYTSGMFDFSKGAEKASKAGNDFNSTLKNINEEARSTALVEIANTDKLFATSTDLNSAYSDRVSAIEKLISLYPELLGNLEREDFLTGNVAGKQKIQDIISYKSAIEARKKSIEEISKEIAALKSNTGLDEDGLNKFGETYDPLDYNGSVFTTRSPKTEAEIKRLTSLMEAFEFAKSSFEKSLADLTSTRHAGRIWVDIDNDIKEQERLIKTTIGGTKEHTKALSELKRYQEEMDVYMGKDKGKKPKKDTISDDLAVAKSDYELQLMLNQQKFANSRKTYFEEQQLNADNLKATTDYGDRYLSIVDNFNKRHLLSENEYKKQLNEANKILLEGQIKAKEAGDKIEEEILKKKIQTNNEMLKYIESLSKQRQELEKINREIDNIQDKAASRKEYAESFAPYLEGFGFNTAFGQQVKQKNADISSRRTELGVLEGNKPNEASDPKTYGMRLLQWETNVAKEKENIAKMEADRDEMYNQKMIEGKKELARKTVELAQQAFEAINTIRNNAFAAEQKQLEIQSQNLKLRTDQEMRAIDAKAGFEASKSNEKSKLAAETAAKENEIRAKSNELSLRQARANKQAAQVSIITNTAASIIKAFVDFPYPVAIPIAAALAATGAVQYSVASSAPLPQYAKGTEGTTAERFIAGEKGAELGVTPSGKTMLFEKEGIYSAPLGTKIKTADQTKKLMQYAINGIGYNGESLNALSQNMHISLDDKKIVDSIKEQTHDIAVTLWKTKGNNNSSTQQAYIDAVREQQNLISKFK